MIRDLTGSGGETPIQDGSARGIIAMALTAGLAFVGDHWSGLSDADLVTLGPVVVGLSFFIGGVYDRLIGKKL